MKLTQWEIDWIYSKAWDVSCVANAKANWYYERKDMPNHHKYKRRQEQLEVLLEKLLAHEKEA